MILKIDFNELNLNINHIENVMGYKSGESGEIIIGLISDVLYEIGNICDIKAECRIYEEIKLNEEDKSLSVGNVLFNINKIIYNQIKKSEKAAFFLCTIGPEPETRSRKAMKEGDLLRGYIFDVTANEVVEAAADYMQNSLESAMNTSGLNITNRFSPGYCGWDVAEQKKLFQLMPENSCGIQLTPSALMQPMKSVSGIIGIGKNVKRRPYSCKLCNLDNCIYRKERSKG